MIKGFYNDACTFDHLAAAHVRRPDILGRARAHLNGHRERNCIPCDSALFSADKVLYLLEDSIDG